MTDRLAPYPADSDKYLEENFGIRPYSDKHKRALMKKKEYPIPIKISDRRFAMRTDVLDQYAAWIMSGRTIEPTWRNSGAAADSGEAT